MNAAQISQQIERQREAVSGLPRWELGKRHHLGYQDGLAAAAALVRRIDGDAIEAVGQEQNT